MRPIAVERRDLLSLVRRLAAEGRVDLAREVAELARVDADAPASDIELYAKALLTAGAAEEADALLESASGAEFRDRRLRDTAHWQSRTAAPLRSLRGGAALDWLLRHGAFETVLDIGAGGGEQAAAFAAAGKRVTALDLGRSVYHVAADAPARHDTPGIKWIIADFFAVPPRRSFDLVWACHVLEHQRNPGAFLDRCLRFLGKDGWLAVTVPPLKHEIVGGHLSLWNAGLLLYHLVMAGNDCSTATVLNYGYNISVIVPRRPIALPDLTLDAGDVTALAPFLPPGCVEGFDGRLHRA